MASKKPKTPGLSGSGERPRYRATPQKRFEHQTKVRIEEKFQGIAEADVSRQHSGSEGHSTLDRALVVFPFEMTYPGRRDDVTMTFRRKWIYAFDVKSRKCILEGRSKTLESVAEDVGGPIGNFLRKMQERIGKEYTIWSYRVGVLKPATFDGDAPLKETGLAGFEIPPELVTDQTGLAFFLSPHRLSQRAIEFLIEKLKVRKSDPDFPFAMVWWNDTTLGHVTLCDPYRWAAEASERYYVQTVEQWQDEAHDPEVNAKLFIAKVVKAWRDAEIGKVDDRIIRKGLAELHIEKLNTEIQKRHEEAEKAAAYTIQCIESPEHRAVEMAAQDFGGKALVDTLANYALVLQGMGMTGPGVMWINTLCEDRERVPWQCVMSDSPPSNCPDYASDSKAFYPATVILSTLGPALLREEMTAGLARGASVEEASGVATGSWRKRLERIYAGRATFSTKNRTTAVDVTSEPVWKAGSDPFAPRTKRRVRQTDVQLEYEHAGSYSDAEVLDPKSDLMAEIHKWGTSSASFYATVKQSFNPLGPIVSLTNLVTSVIGWQSQVSKDETVAVGPFDVQADTVGLMSAVTGMGSSIIELASLRDKLVGTETNKLVGKRLMGASGVLAVATGVFEVAGSNKKGLDAIFGKRNYAEGAGHLMVATGAGLSAIGGAMSLGATIIGAGASGGPVGFIVGVVGAAVAIFGSLVASEFATTPLSEYVKYSFLGTEGDSPTGWAEVSWFDEGLPVGGPVEQASLLINLLASFTMHRVGKGEPDAFSRENFPATHRGGRWLVVGDDKPFEGKRYWDSEPMIQIDLGYFPVGSQLDLEIIQRYPQSRPRAFVSFLQERPGQLVRIDNLEHSEIMFGTAEYLVDNRAIRGFRMELRPLIFGRATVGPMRNNTMRDWRAVCTGCLVKARVSLGGQPWRFRYMPKRMGWVGIHVIGEEPTPVSSLNPGSYISGDVVS